MLTEQEAQKRVAAGTVYLDKEFPEWFRCVDTGKLDLTEPCLCVLGQLHGNYNTAKNVLFPSDSLLSRAMRKVNLLPKSKGVHPVFAYGFDAPKYKFAAARTLAYKRLQDAWIQAIADRMVASEKQSTGVDDSSVTLAVGCHVRVQAE